MQLIILQPEGSGWSGIVRDKPSRDPNPDIQRVRGKATFKCTWQVVKLKVDIEEVATFQFDIPQAMSDMVSTRVLELYRRREISAEVAQQLLPRPIESYEENEVKEAEDEPALKPMKKLDSDLSTASAATPSEVVNCYLSI